MSCAKAVEGLPVPPEMTPAKQPAGLKVLFFTELWERFSYYGMRALLVLFLVAGTEQGGFGWTTVEATRLYGWYTGLVYLTPIIGGYLADRYLGPANAVLLGGAIIALGHFSLAFGTPVSFFIGLASVIVGTGFFKSNISTLVGRLYAPTDPRRDSGFTIFYMGINLGALLGPLVCGYLAQRADLGWDYGFGAAGCGMLLGLAVFAYARSGVLGEALLSGADRPIRDTTPLTALERQRLRALFILVLFVVFFWLAFEQAGTSMTLFAEHSTDRHLPLWLGEWLGIGELPTAWFQSVNPAFILLLAPVFSMLWSRLNAWTSRVDALAKMVLGLTLLALGFVVLVIGAYRSEGGALVSPLFLIGAYFLHTCGELCLSPVGLALVSRLAPTQIAAMVMGVWFLANFFANLASGYLASSLEAVARGDYFTLWGGQADFFVIFVVTSAVAALVLAVLLPHLRHLVAGADAPHR